ncbi:MAG: hydroxyethylthiazole kinase [Verrucomicrobia bacterium]|nr:hydroxyethylthiazole kinase [Verrucomicrobiota bacterium]
MKLSAARIWTNYQDLRRRVPLIHSLTNAVVQDFTANALLALGASPVMSEVSEEIDELVQIAGALNLNIGTPMQPSRSAMVQAARAAATHRKPFVLDPVAVGATRLRQAFVGELLATAVPTVIRGNRAEVSALAGLGWAGRGVDAGTQAPNAPEAVRTAAARAGTTVIATGETDVISDGVRLMTLHNGHPLLTRVTGTGCVVSAFVAAFLAVEPDPVIAGAGAVSVMNVAAELAADRAGDRGPGSFRVCLLDSIDRLQEQDLAARLKLTILE